MRSVGTKKTRQASGLLLALVASTLMLGACGDGIFFASEGPSTTAAATDTNSAASPTPTPTPGTTTTTTGATTTDTAPVPGAAPAPAPAPGAQRQLPVQHLLRRQHLHQRQILALAQRHHRLHLPLHLQLAVLEKHCGLTIAKVVMVASTGKGSNASNTLTAIKNNVGNMGFLSGSIGPTEASQIATYAANPGAY